MQKNAKTEREPIEGPPPLCLRGMATHDESFGGETSTPDSFTRAFPSRNNARSNKSRHQFTRSHYRLVTSFCWTPLRTWSVLFWSSTYNLKHRKTSYLDQSWRPYCLKNQQLYWQTAACLKLWNPWYHLRQVPLFDSVGPRRIGRGIANVSRAAHQIAFQGYVMS